MGAGSLIGSDTQLNRQSWYEASVQRGPALPHGLDRFGAVMGTARGVTLVFEDAGDQWGFAWNGVSHGMALADRAVELLPRPRAERK